MQTFAIRPKQQRAPGGVTFPLTKEGAANAASMGNSVHHQQQLLLAREFTTAAGQNNGAGSTAKNSALLQVGTGDQGAHDVSTSGAATSSAMGGSGMHAQGSPAGMDSHNMQQPSTSRPPQPTLQLFQAISQAEDNADRPVLRGTGVGAHQQWRPLGIAHRGASAELPEHTREAYRKAIEGGKTLGKPLEAS